MQACTFSQKVTMSLVIILAGPLLLDLWLDGAVEFSWTAWALFGVMVVVQSVSGPFFMVQNAVAFMWLQAGAYGVVLALVPLKVLLLEQAGLQGFVGLLAAAQITTTIALTPVTTRTPRPTSRTTEPYAWAMLALPWRPSPVCTL